MSALGVDFPKDRFLRTPVGLIRWVLTQIDNKEKAEANIYSVTTAQLTHLVLQVAHGFSGSKKPPPKSQPTNYLPFPNWKPAESKQVGVDDSTRFVLVELVKQKALPMHVFTALVTPPDQNA